MRFGPLTAPCETLIPAMWALAGAAVANMATVARVRTSERLSIAHSPRGSRLPNHWWSLRQERFNGIAAGLQIRRQTASLNHAQRTERKKASIIKTAPDAVSRTSTTPDEIDLRFRSRTILANSDLYSKMIASATAAQVALAQKVAFENIDRGQGYGNSRARSGIVIAWRKSRQCASSPIVHLT
jgi:hypothetical protein